MLTWASATSSRMNLTLTSSSLCVAFFPFRCKQACHTSLDLSPALQQVATNGDQVGVGRISACRQCDIVGVEALERLKNRSPYRFLVLPTSELLNHGPSPMAECPAFLRKAAGPRAFPMKGALFALHLHDRRRAS